MVRELSDGNLEVTKLESGPDGSARKMVMVLDNSTRLPIEYKMYIDGRLHSEIDLASSEDNRASFGLFHKDKELESRIEAAINPKQ